MRSADERRRLPVAMRHLGDQALATRRASVVADHLRRDRRLVDESEARRREFGLLGFELAPSGGDIRTILLGGVQRFF